jgi:hypothetical protein
VITNVFNILKYAPLALKSDVPACSLVMEVILCRYLTDFQVFTFIGGTHLHIFPLLFFRVIEQQGQVDFQVVREIASDLLEHDIIGIVMSSINGNVVTLYGIIRMGT